MATSHEQEARLQVVTTLSEVVDGVDALRALVAQTLDRLGKAPQLVLLFSSPHHTASWAAMLSLAHELMPDTLIAGCSASGVIGEGHEAEQRVALAMWAIEMDGLEVNATHIRTGQDCTTSQALNETKAPELAIIFADPMSADLETLLPHLDHMWPEAQVVGGLASGGTAPGSHGLFLNGRYHRFGTLVVTLRGPFKADVLVAQGCRPIGEPMLVTQCSGGMIEQLAEQPPVQLLQELYQTLGARDQELFRHSLFAGVEMKDVVEYQRGDFLIRQITGAHPDSGSIQIGAELKPWSVLQFHLRDARTSRDDLIERLQSLEDKVVPQGALLFTCLGRGLHLYGRPDHDTDLIGDAFEGLPLAGFFAGGEIGPVGGVTYLHGYTSVVVLFAPA